MIKVFTRSAKGLLFVTAACLIIAGIIATVIYVQVPSREKIRGCMTTEMYQVHLCPGSKDYVVLNRISKHLQQAVVITEDSAFWDHHGFDFQEIQHSFEKNLEKGRFARGGSTITQQLAKNMFLNANKSLQRKMLEAVITVQLEKNLTKREILERYLNVVQFGKDIYGVKDAAQFYFKKSPANLDVIESAWLAFLLPSPEKYSVSFYKKNLTPFAKKRLRQITASMYRYGRIDAPAYRVALGRTNNFLSGGAPVAVPEGLDLNSPEEIIDDNWGADDTNPVMVDEVPPAQGGGPAPSEDPEPDYDQLMLEADDHAADRPAGQDDGQNTQDSDVN